MAGEHVILQRNFQAFAWTFYDKRLLYCKEISRHLLGDAMTRDCYTAKKFPGICLNIPWQEIVILQRNFQAFAWRCHDKRLLYCKEISRHLLGHAMTRDCYSAKKFPGICLEMPWQEIVILQRNFQAFAWTCHDKRLLYCKEISRHLLGHAKFSGICLDMPWQEFVILQRNFQAFAWTCHDKRLLYCKEISRHLLGHAMARICYTAKKFPGIWLDNSQSSSSSSSDFWLACRYRGNIHISGPPSS